MRNFNKVLIFIDNTNAHMIWLKKHREPWDSVKEHWEASSFPYRSKENKLQKDRYDNILNDD